MEGADERRKTEGAARLEEEEEADEVRILEEEEENGDENQNWKARIEEETTKEAPSSEIQSQREAWKVVLRKRPEMNLKGMTRKNSQNKSKRLRGSPEEL
ncbi:Hypothetical protein FKW44_016770, partial [Caligus rogercresseyi]